MEAMKLYDTKIKLSGGVDGGRGWIGDVKIMLLDIAKIQSIGWTPKFDSNQAVRQTIRKILSV